MLGACSQGKCDYFLYVKCKRKKNFFLLKKRQEGERSSACRVTDRNQSLMVWFQSLRFSWVVLALSIQNYNPFSLGHYHNHISTYFCESTAPVSTVELMTKSGLHSEPPHSLTNSTWKQTTILDKQLKETLMKRRRLSRIVAIINS